MTDTYPLARKHLRLLRITTVVCVALFPITAVIGVVLVELHDVGTWVRSVGLLPLVLLMPLVGRLMTFTCPSCRKSFSRSDRGLQLKNRFCLHCGLDLAPK